MAVTTEQLAEMLLENLTWALENPDQANALQAERENAIPGLGLPGVGVTPPPLNPDGSIKK